jgi:hypothetical protein
MLDWGRFSLLFVCILWVSCAYCGYRVHIVGIVCILWVSCACVCLIAVLLPYLRVL